MFQIPSRSTWYLARININLGFEILLRLSLEVEQTPAAVSELRRNTSPMIFGPRLLDQPTHISCAGTNPICCCHSRISISDEKLFLFIFNECIVQIRKKTSYLMGAPGKNLRKIQLSVHVFIICWTNRASYCITTVILCEQNICQERRTVYI